MADFYGKYSGILGGGGGGGSALTVDENGTPIVTNTSVLNFIGATVTDAGGGQADVTITAGGVSFQEVPAGTVDGINTSFTVSQSVTDSAAFTLFQDGLALDQPSEYTISGTNISMVAAPATGQTLYAVYTIVGSGSGLVNSVSNTNSITLGVSGGDLTANLRYPIVGPSSSPLLVSAAGMAFAGNQVFTKYYIAGNGGPVVITGNPQIAAPTQDGQFLIIQSTDGTNTVTIDGTGTNGVVTNGPWVGDLNNIIRFNADFDAGLWVEECRQR